MTELTSRALRLLVVDDHEVVRQGLVALLDRREAFQVVAEAGTVAEAIDQARRRVPEPHDPTAAANLAGAGPAGNNGHDGIDEVIENWQFMQILGRLPSDEAELLRFRFQGELSQTEIADRTGIPLGTAKSRMASALTRLKGMMEAES